jgi:hypothetical protein
MRKVSRHIPQYGIQREVRPAVSWRVDCREAHIGSEEAKRAQAREPGKKRLKSGMVEDKTRAAKEPLAIIQSDFQGKKSKSRRFRPD